MGLSVLNNVILFLSRNKQQTRSCFDEACPVRQLIWKLAETCGFQFHNIFLDLHLFDPTLAWRSCSCMSRPVWDVAVTWYLVMWSLSPSYDFSFLFWCWQFVSWHKNGDGFDCRLQVYEKYGLATRLQSIVWMIWLSLNNLPPDKVKIHSWLLKRGNRTEKSIDFNHGKERLFHWLNSLLLWDRGELAHY